MGALRHLGLAEWSLIAVSLSMVAAAFLAKSWPLWLRISLGFLGALPWAAVAFVAVAAVLFALSNPRF